MTIAPTAAPATGIPFPAPANAPQYGEDLDAFLGAPATPANLAVTTAWVESESPTFPGYNGLGTTLPLPGSTPVPGNSAGVQEYPSLAEGLAAAADMMLGKGPQTTPLAPRFVADLQSGQASAQTLTNDVAASSWDGSPPDSYDAGAIASKLNLPGWSAPTGSGATPATPAALTGYNLNLFNDLKTLAGNTATSAAKGLLPTVGLFLLKTVISLTGAACFVYGAKLSTERGPAKQSSSPAQTLLPGGAGGAAPDAGGAAETFEAFPEAALL